ncbi:leucine-rich repeat-containing protein 14-like [Antechinus flavipes]|uniref:leucine-rich repeat-containing protein 14-like n=1 Tax=Antechinus flavipes TaxID=38775 RepID=UPI0022369198|nr:leucine-rich repeat-containing protein 14-like [Antechinus flavipes]
MYSLTFLSAQQLAKDEEAACTMLESMPQIMYNILFKVAFRENKKKLLCELVKMWPYSQLKFQALMQICWSCSLTSKRCPECRANLPNSESSINKIDAIVFGVISLMRKAIMDDSQQLPNRRLQQLDMTGLVNQNIWWNLKVMRLWACSISRAQLYVSSQQRHDPQSQTRDQEANASPVTTFPKEMCVELLADLHVSSSSKKFLKEAFSENADSPLHLKCRDLYTTDFIDHDFGQLLSLLDPLTIRRVDLNYSKIILNDIGWFLSQITTFQNLQSLKLPSFSEQEIEKMNSIPTLVDILAAELSKLKHLREICVHSLCLSDQVENLLRDLPCSLQSLQLSFCSLTKKDLIYLAHSQHSTHLIKLDLAGNKLTELDSFLKLLKSASNSLKWLNVTKCGIKDSDFYETLPYLYSCVRLSHLGLHGNPLSSGNMLLFLKSCEHKLPNLKIISVPIFLDCYRDHSHHVGFPRLLGSRLDTGKFGSVLNEMKQMQITRGDSAIEVITSFAFEVGDYFDLQ